MGKEPDQIYCQRRHKKGNLCMEGANITDCQGDSSLQHGAITPHQLGWGLGETREG